MSARRTIAKPFLRRNGSTMELVVDGNPFVMLSGEIHNSSASNLAYMEPIWSRMKAMNLNSVIVPLYWECIEPTEGRFDFSLIDGLLTGAEKHGLKLVLLWFGTWKNAESSYVPMWVKTDTSRFFRAQCTVGTSWRSISAFCEEACKADAKAFAAVMGHIKKKDDGKHSVLMVQVENETGLQTASRDHSPAAEKAFVKHVPEILMKYLTANTIALNIHFRDVWEKNGMRSSGTWREVFGENADEAFMAWHTARYVDAVAAAGKKVFDLPMFANTWLDGLRAGEWPSGGPKAHMLDVWKAAAPHIDILAPDIYRDDFIGTCQEFHRPDNPLFIPETNRDNRCAASAFYAICQHDALCFAPFAIDDSEITHPVGETYALLRDLMPIILKHRGTGTMAGYYQQNDWQNWKTPMGKFQIDVRFRKHKKDVQVPGGGLVIALSSDEFLIAGRNLIIEFGSGETLRPMVEFLACEEGRYQKNGWKMNRVLNGDETDHGRVVRLFDHLSVVKVKVHNYV